MATRRGPTRAGKREQPTPQDADALRPVPALGLGQFTSLAALPVEDRAYALHLRGHSLRAIAARLGIDKDTAHKYVRTVAAELAPLHQEQREALRQETIARLRAIAATAGDTFDVAPEPALLNTQLAAEREIAKLEGLYGSALELDGEGGIQITITRRREQTESEEAE